MHLGTAAVELVGKLGTSLDEVLAIVQDDEEVLVRQDFDQLVGEQPSRRLADPYGGRQGSRHPVGLRDRRQVDEEDPFVTGVQQAASYLQCETGLA